MTGERAAVGAASPDAGPSHGLILAMAVAAGVTVANIYYNQPLLGLIAREFDVSAEAVGLVPSITLAGYGLGIFFLVPLGDRFDRKATAAARNSCGHTNPFTPKPPPVCLETIRTRSRGIPKRLATTC